MEHSKSPKPVNHIAYEVLARAHPTDRAASIFAEKVTHKPLNLRPSSTAPASQDARSARRLQRVRKLENSRRKQKPKPLSAKEKRISGIYDIPHGEQKYDIYVPLNRMWIGYVWEILGLRDGETCFVTAQSAGPKLASADFHGAELEVVRCRCVGRVGCRGIVIKDTKFTFVVVTQANKLRGIPRFRILVYICADLQ